MYHGTDSRAAQLIVCSQRFKASAGGLLGPGIYVTRTRQKAEGYRIHHPNAQLVGGGVRNLPLPSGDLDPGCILSFRARLGACKTFGRGCPASAFFSDSWHDEEVPHLCQTTSMQAAIRSTGLRCYYNTAHSGGCGCCPRHEDECPGPNPLPGKAACNGRCTTGFRNCPMANSSFEEFCIQNTDRIDRIEIVAGPRGLVGLGRSFWEVDQATRDRAVTAKRGEFAAWAADRFRTLRHDGRSQQGADGSGGLEWGNSRCACAGQWAGWVDASTASNAGDERYLRSCQWA
jgi:hypothetical protein